MQWRAEHKKIYIAFIRMRNARRAQMRRRWDGGGFGNGNRDRDGDWGMGMAMAMGMGMAATINVTICDLCWMLL